MQRLFLFIFFLFVMASPVCAVPETVSLRVTDVTPGSLCLVWMTDVASHPSAEIYADSSMSENITDQFRIEAMPDVAALIAEAAREKGIMKVRISGLTASQEYYVRSVTVDPATPSSIGYSALQKVITADSVITERTQEDGRLQHAGNDLLSSRIYLRPSDGNDLPGALLVLETESAQYPLSVFSGSGVEGPEGLFDLNNLFNPQGLSLDLLGGETARLYIYRGLTMSTLLHYRQFSQDEGTGIVTAPVKGFFADFNLDGVVDEFDFEMFKEHYRCVADDVDFNPDMNLVPVQEDMVTEDDEIDARDFARFATEYGNDSL